MPIMYREIDSENHSDLGKYFLKNGNKIFFFQIMIEFLFSTFSNIGFAENWPKSIISIIEIFRSIKKYIFHIIQRKIFRH